MILFLLKLNQTKIKSFSEPDTEFLSTLILTSKANIWKWYLFIRSLNINREKHFTHYDIHLARVLPEEKRGHDFKEILIYEEQYRLFTNYGILILTYDEFEKYHRKIMEAKFSVKNFRLLVLDNYESSQTWGQYLKSYFKTDNTNQKIMKAFKNFMNNISFSIIITKELEFQSPPKIPKSPPRRLRKNVKKLSPPEVLNYYGIYTRKDYLNYIAKNHPDVNPNISESDYEIFKEINDAYNNSIWNKETNEFEKQENIFVPVSPEKKTSPKRKRTSPSPRKSSSRRKRSPSPKRRRYTHRNSPKFEPL